MNENRSQYWRSTVLPAVALFLPVFLAYYPALFADFIWDDAVYVSQNLITRPGGLRVSWFSAMQPNYWPVTWTAFWVEWRLFGMSPAGYHAVNILLHAVNALLAWRLLLRLRIPGAWVAAAVFALHPVNVESTAWISQLKTLLSMGFFLASLLVFVRTAECEKGRMWLYLGSLALFGLSLLAKPVTVAQPIVMLLICWWRQGRIRRRDLLLVAPFVALALGLGFVEIWFQYTRNMEKQVVLLQNPAVRLARSGWIILFYLWKLVLPYGLVTVYPKWVVDPSKISAWLPLGVVIAALGTALVNRQRWGRHVLLAMGSYVAMLFPVLGFIDIGFMDYSYVADHFQYVAVLGPIALLVSGATVVVRKLCGARPLWIRLLPATLCAVLIVLTFRQARVYRDMETLWKSTLDGNPQASSAYGQLAAWYVNQGENDKALEYCRKGIAAFPDDASVQNNMANVLLRMNDCDEAIRLFRRAIALAPQAGLQHLNLGNALETAGHLDEAIENYRRELEISPTSLAAWIKLGTALQRQGKHAEAEAAYRQAIMVTPNSQTAVCYLGRALAAQGRTTEAVEFYREAIRMDPDDPEAHANLGIALTALKDYAGAAGELETAARLSPQSSQIRRLLDEALKRKAQ